ncbi:YlbL family protein [Rhodococcus sp. SGAir0479]|uniref:YlbL family protein n=1 Tax=Rhodococcus sp. SGAir0479 TaxID=2567884 RepID=UPI001C2FF21E|nr:PDZ domain-containing protein [Rhodococcus sp. SGAir0479]
MNRRMVTLLAALAPVAALGVLGTTVQVPFVALGPGPTVDTLGEADVDVDGQIQRRPVVDIEGTAVDATSGNLNMTTVAVRDKLTLFDALGLWASGRQGLVPREEVYPPDRSKNEIQDENTAQFTKSENSAELAALRYLGLPVALELTTVGDDGPAASVLKPGDVLLRVDGKPVDTLVSLQELIGATAPGTIVQVTYRRDGVEATAPITVGARPAADGEQDAGKGYLGVNAKQVPDVPFTIDFNLADIGGPSAGLMFSLAVVDKLSPGELNGGRFVAGTGTIDPDGDVGPIGGIPYKMIAAQEAGATTFLVPAKNCDEALANRPDGLQLVKVETLGGAVDALEAIDAGQPAPSC